MTNAALGLASVAVLTRFLPPSAFGQLAILIFFSELLAILCDLGILQGTMRSVLSPGPESGDERQRRRQTMTTGLIVTLAIAAVLTAVVAVLADPIAEFILGDRRDGALVIYAAVTGAALGCYRLLVNQLRYARRPAAYNALLVFRGIAVLAASAILLSQTATLHSAVLGMAIGSLSAMLLTALVMRREFGAAPAWSALSDIWRRGAPWVPIAAGLWFINTGAVVILGVMSSAHTLGTYRAAVAVAALVSYYGAVFYMSWGPLTRSSLYLAAQREAGAERLKRAFASAYLIGAGTLVAVIAIFQNELVKLLGHAYVAAAPLIALLAVPHVFYGLFRMLYVTTTDPRKVQTFRTLVLVATALFAAVGFALASSIGAYSIAVAQGVAFGAAAGAMAAFEHAHGRPLPIDARRTTVALLCAGGCVAFDRSLALTGFDRAVIDVACAALLVVAWLRVGVVSLTEARMIAQALRPGDRHRAHERWMAYLANLDRRERQQLRALMDTGRQGADAGPPEDDQLPLFGTVIREMTGGRATGQGNEALAEYLLARDMPAYKDSLANRLIAAGEDPLEVDRMSSAVLWLRRLPPRTWRKLDAQGPGDPPEPSPEPQRDVSPSAP